MDLSTYIDNGELIDGHVHAFSHDAQIVLPKKCIWFADIVLDKPQYYGSTNLKSLYKSFNHTPTQLPLATGLDLASIDAIYNSIKCYGFGELKLYDEYKGTKVNLKNIGFVHEVCEYSKNHGMMPVYIHYTIENERDIKDISEVCSTSNDINITLCHCGADHRVCDVETSIKSAMELQAKYANLWLDISYSAFDYFVEHPDKLDDMPFKNRCFIGSDSNPAEVIHNIENNFKRDAKILLNHIPSNQNLRNLFGYNF